MHGESTRTRKRAMTIIRTTTTTTLLLRRHNRMFFFPNYRIFALGPCTFSVCAKQPVLSLCCGFKLRNPFARRPGQIGRRIPNGIYENRQCRRVESLFVCSSSKTTQISVLFSVEPFNCFVLINYTGFNSAGY